MAKKPNATKEPEKGEEKIQGVYGVLVRRMADGSIKWGPIKAGFEKEATLQDSGKLIRELVQTLNLQDTAGAVIYALEQRARREAGMTPSGIMTPKGPLPDKKPN